MAAITMIFSASVVLAANPAEAKHPRFPWCGWYMMKVEGVTDRRYYRARHWLNYGTRAAGPCVGCIVVWAHHVGKIVGRTATGWLVHSGNDSNRVRTRERSLHKAIGFRRP